MKTLPCLALALLLPLATSALASEPALTSVQAANLAQEAVSVAVKQGYRVSATVVDADGVILATVRGNGASPTSAKTTFKKAFTAISAKENTSDFLVQVHKNGHEFLDKFVLSTLASGQDNIILLGGGILIKDKDTIIGAIGVGGAPGGHLDDNIAREAMANLKM